MRLATSILLILVSPLALAHGGPHSHELFVNGLLHPFTGIDHLITWLGLGGAAGVVMAWSGTRGRVMMAAVTGIGLLSWIGHTVLIGGPSPLFQLGLGVTTAALLVAGCTLGYRLVRKTTASL